VSAGGDGKLVHPDNDPPPDTWHYEAKQLDKHVGTWFQGGRVDHPDYDWSVWLESLPGASPVRDTGSGRGDALLFLVLQRRFVI